MGAVSTASHARPIFYIATVCGALLFLAVAWSFFYGQTVDVGLHYGLTMQRWRQFHGAALTREHLGVMVDYPSGAHWAAAALSVVTGSRLLAINVLDEVAIYATYVCIAAMLVEEAWLPSIWRLAVLSIAVGFLASQLAAFGDQVMLSFFFPQLLGESIVFAVLCFLSAGRFAQSSFLSKATALVLMIGVLGFVQPLAALQLGVSVSIFALFSVFARSPAFRMPTFRQLAVPAGLSGVAICAVILHPQFATMRAISSNDGYLRFGPVLEGLGFSWLVVLAVVSAGIALFGASRGALLRRPALVLASATLGGAILLIAQRTAFDAFGLGSDYAVRKHVFFLTTTTAATLAFVSTLLLRKAWRQKSEQHARQPWIGALPAVFALAAAGLVLRSAEIWRQDLRPILAYQAYVEDYHRYYETVEPHRNIGSFNHDLTPVVNYAISLGDLEMPLTLANRLVESSASLDTPVKYAIVNIAPKTRVARERCTLQGPSSTSFAVVDRLCFLKANATMPRDRLLNAGSQGEAARFLATGWDTVETWATWSTEETATIEFDLPPANGTLHFDLHVFFLPFIGGNRREQRFVVTLDQGSGQIHVARSPEKQEFVVPIDVDGHHVVALQISEPISPYDAGVSEVDHRKLGIAVLALELRSRAGN